LNQNRSLRGRIVAVVVASVLILVALLLYSAFRSAGSAADSKLRSQTTLQLARARVDLAGALSRSNSHLYLAAGLLHPQSHAHARSFASHAGAVRLVRLGRSYALEQELVVAGRSAPLVRLTARLPVTSALLDRLGQPKVDTQAKSVLSRHGIVIAGDQALLGLRLPVDGNATIRGNRYAVASTPIDTAASLQVLVPNTNTVADLASAHRNLLGAAALVLVALAVCLFLLGRPLWRSLGEVIETAHESWIDDLTGLASGRAFWDALALEFERSRSNDEEFSLALLDVDNLDQVDAVLGTATGDGALRSVSAVIRRALGAGGLAARTGRSEFVLLFPDADSASAAELAERIRTAVEEVDIREGWALTASVGVATSAAEKRPRQLLLEAENALARAKAIRRNRTDRELLQSRV
jgi:diguanylate cyclase (GGDEF)-like protein